VTVSPIIHRRRRLVAFAAVALLAAAVTGCGGRGGAAGGRDGGLGTRGPDELFGETASFEVVAERPGRVMIGLSTTDGRVLAGGEVTFEIGPSDGSGTPITTPARYISVPGMPAVSGGPRIDRPSRGIGVYAADAVTIPTAGFWTIHVKVPGMSNQAPEASFEVLASGQVPTVGDDAPRTKNLVLATPGVRPEWLDSTADADHPPDALLHSTVIADAIAAHQRVVIVVSTPAFCTSRFCGPTTELVRETARRLQGQNRPVQFVHLEVWRDYEAKAVNKGAAEWILRDGAEGREPWVFLVGSDGKVAARFDNVVPADEFNAAVDTLR
jgi:hypothetical protein